MDITVVLEERSVRVHSAAPGSAAYSLGIRAGDRLTHVGGIPVCNAFQAEATWREQHVRGRDDLTIWRDSEVLCIPVPTNATLRCLVVTPETHWTLVPEIPDIDLRTPVDELLAQQMLEPARRAGAA
ncbi:MAG: PDZ domain-containing protein [Actinomycetes bacterium]